MFNWTFLIILLLLIIIITSYEIKENFSMVGGGATSPGTLLQLVAKGPQDIYLTGIPDYVRYGGYYGYGYGGYHPYYGGWGWRGYPAYGYGYPSYGYGHVGYGDYYDGPEYNLKRHKALKRRRRRTLLDMIYGRF